MKLSDASRMRNAIMRARLCSKVLSENEDVYLVGGYIRDLLIKGVRSRDIDFVARKNVRRLANAAASSFGGRVVELRKERMLRVVLKSGAALDFSRMEGDIEEDLGRRDFTINAMAWSPAAGLIDPSGGLRDIKKGVIKAVSGKNLKDDPLRILRAYRFSAELKMPISNATRGLIRPLARNIRTSASERITLELFKLLNSENPTTALSQALSDGVLSRIISLSNNRLRANIQSISKLNRNIQKTHEMYFVKDFSQGLTIKGLLRLEQVLMGAKTDDLLLSLSSVIRKRVEIAGKLYGEFVNIDKINKSNLFELFSSAGTAAWDLLMLAGKTTFLKDLKRYQRIQAKGLLCAEEIMAICGIESGPRLGKLIADMKRMQFAGKLRNRQSAKRWLLSR